MKWILPWFSTLLLSISLQCTLIGWLRGFLKGRRVWVTSPRGHEMLRGSITVGLDPCPWIVYDHSPSWKRFYFTRLCWRYFQLKKLRQKLWNRKIGLLMLFTKNCSKPADWRTPWDMIDCHQMTEMKGWKWLRYQSYSSLELPPFSVTNKLI